MQGDNDNGEDKDDRRCLERLEEMGVDVMKPDKNSRREQIFAQALEDFSQFVLEEERDACRAILERHLDDGSVGELQGGTNGHEIYRVSISTDEQEQDAANELLNLFHSATTKKKYASVLTAQKLQQYMLGMCERRARNRGLPANYYDRLGNLMWILSFEPMAGQVRHIDAMDPNVQICCYMSRDCPSTIIYSLEDTLDVTNTSDLVECWSHYYHRAVPNRIQTILLEGGDVPLQNKFHTKYFGFWKTLNEHLKCFGKLYQPVDQALPLRAVGPGTTLLAAGDQVHAGPPTQYPRMFAFAIGIPQDADSDDIDGEVQYNPVLLHVDLCCILFSLMDLETKQNTTEEKDDGSEDVATCKRFLLDLLVSLVREYPQETYARLLDDNRREVRDWLGAMVGSLENPERIEELLGQAIESHSMFYSPDVVGQRRGRWSKKKQRKRRNADKGR